MVRASSQNVGTGRDPKVATGGKYHFIINKAEEHTAGTGNVAIRLEVEVLAGNIADQDGKTMQYQDFYPDGAGFFDLAAALGLTDALTGQAFTPAMLKQMRDDIKAGKQVATDYDFSAAECEGRQFFANVVPNKKDGKVDPNGWPRLGLEIMSIVDPRTKAIPAREDLIESLIGMKRAALFANAPAAPQAQQAAAPAAAQPAPAPAPQLAAAAAGASPLD